MAPGSVSSELCELVRKAGQFSPLSKAPPLYTHPLQGVRLEGQGVLRGWGRVGGGTGR